MTQVERLARELVDAVAARDAALLAPLRAEVEEMTRTRIAVEEANAGYTKRLMDRVDAAEAEAARLREALAFYANPDTYRSPSSGFALQYDPMPKPIEIDHGGRAQRTLKTL